MEHDDFFEEDLTLDEALEEGPKAKKAKKKPAKSAKSAKESGTGKTEKKAQAAPEMQSVQLTWVIALVISAFIVGFLTSRFFGNSASGYVQGLPAGHTPVVPGQQAPPLSQEQMKAGQLPEGHVPIPKGAGGAAGSKAGASTKTDTSKKSSK